MGVSGKWFWTKELLYWSHSIAFLSRIQNILLTAFTYFSLEHYHFSKESNPHLLQILSAFDIFTTKSLVSIQNWMEMYLEQGKSLKMQPIILNLSELL